MNKKEEEILYEEGRKYEESLLKKNKKKEIYNEMVKLRVAKMTLEEIGKKYNFSRQRVAQILGKTGNPNEKEILEKQCKFCGHSFKTKVETRIYCSTTCFGFDSRLFKSIPLNIKSGTKEYEKLKSRILYKRNAKKILKYNKKWRDNNKDKLKIINRRTAKRYRALHREEINKKAREKRLKEKQENN
ncbi:MAG: hypothetical protein KAT66_00325 [Candidatus Lokiarchaeota archaeon]|nr:hypothetical protein [Candidatus Lokiarchaeota archaeon]